MNKKTIISLLLIANLYGHISSANEVVMSSSRLQNLSTGEISNLIAEGAVRIENDQALLNMNVLNNILRDGVKVNNLAFHAKAVSTQFIPYGHTLENGEIRNRDLAETLTARFVPYGNTID